MLTVQDAKNNYKSSIRIKIKRSHITGTISLVNSV